MRPPTITRSDGSTVEPTIISRGAPGRKVEWSQTTEPVVGPLGHVQEARVDSPLREPGLRLVIEREGQLLLTRHAHKLGYVFYKDICMGVADRSDGQGKTEPLPVFWQIHRKFRQLKTKNQVPRTPIADEDLYHPEVVRRRSLDSEGVRRLESEEVSRMIEEIRAQGTDDEDARAIARDRGLEVPDAPADTDVGELIARGKKARGKK